MSLLVADQRDIDLLSVITVKGLSRTPALAICIYTINIIITVLFNKVVYSLLDIVLLNDQEPPTVTRV